jgi:cysteine desulfurase
VQLPVYLDHHATTPVDPRVLEAMTPYFSRVYGNPSSRGHVFGWEAEAAVDAAREALAGVLGASPKEIVFTSGATEADNLAIFGVARLPGREGGHVVTAVTEHPAVLDACRRLEREGFGVTYLRPERSTGTISPERVREALTDRTFLVSLMTANNEIGVLLDVAGVGAVCRERGVLFHTDAVQAFGKVPFDLAALPVDLASVSAHKLYGPKGVGALFVRARHPRVRLEPMLHGGGQERGIRSGTLNVPGIVGLARAAEIAAAEMDEESRRLRRLRRRLNDALFGRLAGVGLNGPALPAIDAEGNLAPGQAEARLPGNLNVSFAGVDGEALLVGMKDVAVSTGSACTSASLEPSHVLTAIGTPADLAHASIRYGLGRSTTAEEVDFAADAAVRTVERLRETSPAARSR